MPYLRCQVLLALLALAGNLAAQDAPPDVRERLDAVRRSVAPLNRELAGQRSTASTHALFGETRRQFADWQKLVQGTALEPTAEAMMRYVDDTGEAVRTGQRDQAEFLLQQLDQLPPFVKDEIPAKGVAPFSADPVVRAGAIMTPLLMRLRAAFYALIEGDPKGAEQILAGAKQPFAEWTALCQGTPFSKPAADFTAMLGEAAGAFAQKTDPKRIQAMVDILNHAFEELAPALQKNRPAGANAALRKLQAEWQRIDRETDAQFFAAVPLSSLPKEAPKTAQQALAQLPGLRDALDEVYQTLWGTGRAAPSVESLDHFRNFFAEWRKPLDQTSAGPLIAALADSLGEAGNFLERSEVFSAQILIESLLGTLSHSMKDAAALPPGDPLAKSAPLAIVRAQLMTARQCLLRYPKSAERLIRLSLQQALVTAENFEGTPQAAAAAFLVGQLETLQRLSQDGNEQGAFELCAAITAKGLRFSQPSEAGENSHPSGQALGALGVWLALADGFDWEQAPELAKSLLVPAMVQFDQWKAQCHGTPAQSSAESLWLLAAQIPGLLAQDQPEAARLLASAFQQRLSELERNFPVQATPSGILEVYLRAIKLALDPSDRAPNAKTALAIAYAANEAHTAFSRGPEGRTTDPLQNVLDDGWRALSKALRKGDIAEARTLLDVVVRQTRLSTKSPQTSQPSRVPAVSRPTSGPYEIAADDTLLSNIVATISRNYAVRICFEEIDLDPQKDALTAAAVLKDLEAKARGRKLSPAEADRLDSARRAVNDHGPKILLDSGAPRLTAKFRADSLEELLEKLTTGTLYAWRKIGSTFVILPRAGSVLDFPVTADVSGLTMQAAAQRMACQRPSGGPIGLRMVILGMYAPGKDPISLLQTRVPSLTFRGQSALEAFCRLTESTNPTFSWALSGYRQARGLSVYALPDDSPRADTDGTRPAAIEKENYVLDYENASMTELIARLRADFPERLCYEQAPGEHLSASATVRRLEEGARRTSPGDAEKKLLKAARQAAQNGQAFDAGARHSGRAAAATFEGLLDQLTRGTDYAWRKTSGAFVVFPLNGGLTQTPLTVSLPTGSLSENVRKTLDAIPHEWKGKALVKTADGFDPNAAVPAMDFETGTVAEALCRLTADSGSSWNLQAPEKQPQVTLLPHAKGR